MILFDGLTIGMKENMIKTATSTFSGQCQIHKEGFTETFDVEKTIEDSQATYEKLKSETIVKAATIRTMAYGMLSSAYDVSSIILYGINSETEERVSRIHEAVKEGDFFKSGNGEHILIGEKLAENLDVKLGDRLVVTVAQANTGELSQEMFRVGGIFQFNVKAMDSSFAFISLAKSQKLLHIGNNYHEIAFDLNDIKLSGDKNLFLWDKYSKNGNKAMGWNRIFTELDGLLEMSQFSLMLTAFILFGVVALGIVNTLFMSLYERMFEFGVLRAIGTRPFRMALIIVMEAASLAVISIIIGILLGYILTYLFTIVGFDYRGLEFGGVTIAEMLYPVFAIKQYIVYPIWLFFLTTLVGIYPAVYAAKLTPAKAMRKSF